MESCIRSHVVFVVAALRQSTSGHVHPAEFARLKAAAERGEPGLNAWIPSG